MARTYSTPAGTSGWANNSGNTGLTSVTPAVLMAANPGYSYFVTGIQVTNYHATLGLFQILDGATVIFTGAPGSNSPYIVDLTTPLRGTLNTALKIQAAAAANLFYSVQGYIGI